MVPNGSRFPFWETHTGHTLANLLAALLVESNRKPAHFHLSHLHTYTSYVTAKVASSNRLDSAVVSLPIWRPT